MRLEELKKGFWGYQKDAVFRYITQQEEAFTQKLTEKDAQIERVQARIQTLEQEKHALQEELGRLRERQEQIGQAILDARDNAEALKTETCAQEELARETIRQALERDMAELAGYRGKIAELRKAIQAFGKNLEQRTEEMEQQAEELYEAAPKGNLTLFQ